MKDQTIKINDKKMNTNFFVEHNRVNEMILFYSENFTLSLLDIYQYIKDKNVPFKVNIKENLDLELNVTSIDDVSFDFEIIGVYGSNILREPIIYNNNGEYYEFVTSRQIKWFLKKFSEPMIFCKNINGLINISYLDFKIHLGHGDKIVECFKYTYEENFEQFNLFFKNHKTEFIKKEFINALDFDKNFNYYFNYKENLNEKEKFYIYEGKNHDRKFIQLGILDNIIDVKIFIYYGISGKGKSITLIGSLKYRNNLLKIGSLYINCKTLKNLIKNKAIKKLKQLLIDEIIYLTVGNFQQYKNMVEYIKSFNFKTEYDFWLLIEYIIINYCDDNLQYIFGFDQYNDSNDLNNHLKKLKIFCKEKDNIKFVIFSSMNENDVRKIKIQNLFYDNNPISEDEQYIELNNLCDIKEISKTLNYEQIQIWKKLGYSLKVLMELKNSSDLQVYLKNKKINLTYKIISFFFSETEVNKYYNKKKDEIIKIPLTIVSKILSFSTEYSYKREEISEILDNIPFRYFNILKKNELYTTEFGFPLVKDIMKDLYKFIIFEYEYSKIKNILNNKGSGLATIFEMKIIFSLLPNKYNANLFYNFIINEHIIIESIVKKSNEIKKNKIQKLKDNTNYITEQEIFGGKDLDCLIINIIDSTPYAYAFQISTYKPEIFKVSYLKDSLNNMIDNINQTFHITVEQDNTFFGYIFDYSRIKDEKYPSMLAECKSNNYKYCFFDTEKKIFCNSHGKEINDINLITCCPFTNNQRGIKNIKNSDNNLLINSFYEVFPTKFLLNNIMAIISKDLDKTINAMKYKGEQNIGPNIPQNMVYVRMLDFYSNALIIYSKNKSFVVKVIKDSKIIESRNMIELGKYHAYEIN